MDFETLQKAAAEHPYVLITLFVGFLVRLMKSDTKFPIDIPSGARKYVAAVLAALGATIEKMAMGVPTRDAMIHGLIAWAAADFGHKVVIDDIRGGKEIPIPLLMIPGAAPSPGKPPSIPPKKGPPSVPPGVTSLIAAFVLFAFCNCLQACLPVKDPSKTKEQALTVIQLACIAANAFLPNQEEVMKVCQITKELGPQVADLILAQKKAALARGGDKLGSGGEVKPVCISGEELVVCTP